MKVTEAYILSGQTPPPRYFFILFCLTPPPLLAAYGLNGWPLIGTLLTVLQLFERILKVVTHATIQTNGTSGSKNLSMIFIGSFFNFAATNNLLMTLISRTPLVYSTDFGMVILFLEFISKSMDINKISKTMRSTPNRAVHFYCQ